MTLLPTIILAIFAVVALGSCMALPAWWLWNWLCPVFGLPELTFLQAWGLAILIRLLLPGGSGSGSSSS